MAEPGWIWLKQSDNLLAHATLSPRLIHPLGCLDPGVRIMPTNYLSLPALCCFPLSISLHLLPPNSLLTYVNIASLLGFIIQMLLHLTAILLHKSLKLTIYDAEKENSFPQFGPWLHVWSNLCGQGYEVVWLDRSWGGGGGAGVPQKSRMVMEKMDSRWIFSISSQLG